MAGKDDKLFIYVENGDVQQFVDKHVGQNIQETDDYYKKIVFLSGTGEIVTHGQKFGDAFKDFDSFLCRVENYQTYNDLPVPAPSKIPNKYGGYDEIDPETILYRTIDTNRLYRWVVNKYYEIGPELTLGNISGTAFDGGQGNELQQRVTQLEELVGNKDQDLDTIIERLEKMIVWVEK